MIHKETAFVTALIATKHVRIMNGKGTLLQCFAEVVSLQQCIKTILTFCQYADGLLL